MRLTAQTRLLLSAGEEVFRKPSFWDKFKGVLGSDVDLRTGEMSVAQNALGMTEQVQQALKLAKLTNAVSLVVDKDIVYQDLQDRPDDADMLLDAARRNAVRFTQPFDVIRIVFEWQGSGIHVLIEATVRSKFKRGEPAVIVAYGARIDALRPKDGEDTEAARDRIGKALGDANLVPVSKNALDQLVGRVESGLSRLFGHATLETDPADIQVVKPSAQQVREMASHWDHRADVRPQPYYGAGYGWGHRYYDPWGAYYYDPMDTFVSMTIIDAFASPHYYHHHWGYDPCHLGSSWSSYGSPVTFMNHNGMAYGTADHFGDFQQNFSDFGNVAQSDFSSASWDDSAMSSYDASTSGFGGSDAASGTWDCADAGSSTDSASSVSSDCAFDCAASDCSWDCSSDCSSDCGGSDW